MNNIKKYKIRNGLILGLTVVGTVLAAVAMLFEFDTLCGYYKNGAVARLISNVTVWGGAATFGVGAFAFRKREMAECFEGDGIAGRFFASLAGCLCLLEAYVRFSVWRYNATSNDPLVIRGNIFTALTAFASVCSFIVFLTYAFGGNKKRNESRALYGYAIVAMLVLRLMESHFTWTIQMNSPMKVGLQSALIASAIGMIGVLRTELPVEDRANRLRLFGYAASPLLTVPFAVAVIAGYFAKIYTSFDILVDSLFLIALNGFIVFSRMKTEKAVEVTANDWDEYDREVERLNGVYEEFPESEAPADRETDAESAEFAENGSGSESAVGAKSEDFANVEESEKPEESEEKEGEAE